MESKCRRQTTISNDKFNWSFSPTAGDLFTSTKLMQQKEDKEHQEKEDNEDFLSAGTRFSRCSSAISYEAFATAKTTLSRSSSLNRIEFQDFPRRSAIQEFSHCEGWPFGLCRKLLLLPPLPKSPSDSWSWRKSARTIKIYQLLAFKTNLLLISKEFYIFPKGMLNFIFHVFAMFLIIAINSFEN